EAGRIEYRDALVVDAAGRRASLTNGLGDGEVELRVPDAFLDQARFPIMVDPLVQVITAASNTLDHANPDAVYDQAADVWLVVCEEVVAANDHDIRCDRFRGSGSFLETVYFENGPDDAREPAIAAAVARSRAIVVWLQNNVVVGNVRNPASPLGPTAAPSFIGPGANFSPALGGDSGSSGRCLVTFGQGGLSGNTSLLAQVCNVGSFTIQNVGNPVSLDPINACHSRAAVSRDCKGGSWLVAWSSRCSPGGTFFAAVDSATAGVTQPKTAIPNPGLDDHPTVAGDGVGEWVVAWERDLTVDKDIFGSVVRNTGGAYVASASVDLTLLEPGTAATADQTEPAIAFDGCRYAYAYLEAAARGSVRAATLRVLGGAPVFDEGHVPLSSAVATQSATAMAARAEGAGAPTDYLVCWRQKPLLGAIGSIQAALYQGHDPGPQSQIVATGCPSAGAPTIAFSGA
ncbi:MAG: hypothetical protein L0227_14395, partial [Chloroflexi bacterium]|nr:hypothetical protein [Chloroflexota bacterium]